MKNSWLILGGVGVIGFALYRYFKSQVDLALQYDYNVKNLNVVSVEGDKVSVSVDFDITNKSNFEIIINSYELEFYFKDVYFGSSVSTNPIKILPNSKFTVKANGVIDSKAVKISALSLASDIWNRKPINIQLKGNIRIKFIGISTTLNFDKENFEYSADLLKEYGLDKPLHNLAVKYPKLGSALGIK
jgi:LEA14-like dessication related protein